MQHDSFEVDDAPRGARLSGVEIRRRWISACVRGELLGFVPPAATGATLVAIDAPELLLIPALALAGVAEGIILGAAQARTINELLPTVTGWTQATATAAGLAWFAGMAGSSVVEAGGPRGLLIAVPLWIVGLLSMGFLQARRLRTVSSTAYRWWPVTTLAWLLGVMLPVAALSVVPNSWPLAVHVVAAISGAVAMGAIVAVVSAPTLVAIVDRFDPPGSLQTPAATALLP